jgi:hypothetical protein
VSRIISNPKTVAGEANAPRPAGASAMELTDHHNKALHRLGRTNGYVTLESEEDGPFDPSGFYKSVGFDCMGGSFYELAPGRFHLPERDGSSCSAPLGQPRMGGFR